MKIIDNLEFGLSFSSPVVMTIGNFDGVHLGHQAILKELKSAASSINGLTAVITFPIHPAKVLRPHQAIHQICSLQHKIKLLREQQIDFLILLEFNKAFSEQSAAEFLQKTRQKLPFLQIVLGYDAVIGRGRHGDRQQLENIANHLHFKVTYLDEQTVDGKTLSSTGIRRLIQNGELSTASQLLGRNYSIYSQVAEGKKIGQKLGFPTANVDVQGLCLPPLGVYAVRVKVNNALYDGVANLGIAPTVRQDSIPTLEVFLFDVSIQLYGQYIEVIFVSFIRPEVKFDSREALKNQIKLDVAEAKKHFAQGAANLENFL